MQKIIPLLQEHGCVAKITALAGTPHGPISDCADTSAPPRFLRYSAHV